MESFVNAIERLLEWESFLLFWQRKKLEKSSKSWHDLGGLNGHIFILHFFVWVIVGSDNGEPNPVFNGPKVIKGPAFYHLDNAGYFRHFVYPIRVRAPTIIHLYITPPLPSPLHKSHSSLSLSPRLLAHTAGFFFFLMIFDFVNFVWIWWRWKKPICRARACIMIQWRPLALKVGNIVERFSVPFKSTLVLITASNKSLHFNTFYYSFSASVFHKFSLLFFFFPSN